MSMLKAAQWAFPMGALVIDGFHVELLSADAVEQARFDQRWKEIDREVKAFIKSRKQGAKYKPIVLTNGDTPKQLLARSRYILYKMPHQWTKSQKHRAFLLFQLYPSFEQAYNFHMNCKTATNWKIYKKAKILLVDWIKRAQDNSIGYFQSEAESLITHLERIVGFFTYQSTNAHAESLNTQIKLFRSNLRGVIDIKLFLYRLEKIFA